MKFKTSNKGSKVCYNNKVGALKNSNTKDKSDNKSEKKPNKEKMTKDLNDERNDSKYMQQKQLEGHCKHTEESSSKSKQQDTQSSVKTVEHKDDVTGQSEDIEKIPEKE